MVRLGFLENQLRMPRLVARVNDLITILFHDIIHILEFFVRFLKKKMLTIEAPSYICSDCDFCVHLKGWMNIVHRPYETIYNKLDRMIRAGIRYSSAHGQVNLARDTFVFMC